MRNLKRALSLVLALVMLVGMMAINTNAASNFADADEIVNQEAVAITAGMGLFAGSDGKFNPKGNVTRAQMATIIVKMLRGSDFNADAFKGAANPFTDTAAFEGGWAEGYVNACYQMGIVKGYGDGTFKPGNSVTTAEAVTMIINALKVDAGAGEWPLTVMAKATEMKLFGDLNPAPATNEALIRDQLAVITLEGLQYSENGTTGYKVNGLSGTFESYADALKAVMLSGGSMNVSDITEVMGEDTLASEVYSLGVVTGFVTDNQAIGADYTVVGNETFDVETGLDMFGHYVSVYYKVPAAGEYVEAYETYAVVEESTTVVVAEDIDSSKEYKTAFGRNYELAAEVMIFDGEYNETDAMDGAVAYVAGSSAPKGTYVIFENQVVAFLQPGTAVASQILAITDIDGEKTYTLAGVDNPIDEADITVYGGAKKEDYVTYTMAGGQYVLSPVDPVKGTASKYATDAEGEINITVNGTVYPLFAADNATGLEADPSTLTLSTEQYTFYLTQDGKIVGWAAADGSSSTDVNVDDIVYALGWFKLESKNGNYGEKVKKYYLQGVNTEGDEAHVLIAVEYDNNKDGTYGGEGDDATLGTVPETEALREGFYITGDPENKDAKKEGVKTYIRIGVKDERNAETGYLFYGLNRYGSTGENNISWPSSYANNHVCTTACTGEDPTKHNNTIVSGASSHSGNGDENSGNKTTRTFFGSDVRYVMIDGELGETLKTDAGDSDFKWTLPGGEAMKHPMLFKLNDVGATEVVMIAIRKDPNDLKASTSTIFVASSEPVASSADGDLYTVYTASSGAKQEVVIHGTDGESAPEVGFWSYKVEEDGSWTQLNKTTDDQSLGYTTGTLTELYFAGLFDGKTVSATFADGSSVPYITGADASGAKIVDLRSEAQKSADGISTITSVEQLANLAESGKLVTVYIYNKGRTTTGCIYVKAIGNNPTGVVFLPAVGASTAYTLTGSTTALATTGSSDLAGFVRVKNVQGSVTLEQVTGDKYYDGVVATAMADGVLTTEAGDLKIGDSTVIVNLTAVDIEDTDDLAAAIGSYSLTVSGVCESGKTASIIFITGMVDEMIEDGQYAWIDTALLATTTAGKITAKLDSKNGVAHDIYYNEVSVLDGMTEVGGAYYLINKADNGAVSLVRSCTYFQEEGDVLFLTSKASAVGKVCTAIVVDAASAAAGETVYYVAAAKANNNYQTGRFAVVKDTGGMTFWHSGVAKYFAGLDGKIGVHEAITAVDTTAGTFTMGAFSDGSHSDGNHCHYCNRNSNYTPNAIHNYTGSKGYIMGSYGSVACENSSLECAAIQKFTSTTAIVNLSDETISGTTVAEKLASIKALCDTCEVMVEVYSPDGTATVVIVRDICPYGDECENN